MNFLRNTFGVLVGLAVASFVISLGIRLNPVWINYREFAPFTHWENLLKSVRHEPYFYIVLLFSSGIGSTIGGITTAIIVKYAKVAYAILIGFILLFVAMLDIIIFPYHPIFYKISIFITFFPFSWFGGKIVEIIYERHQKKQQ
jgi:predicted MFS family arabinose efflux permease